MTLQERLIIGSLVLLESIDGIAYGFTAFDLIQISKCGIAEGHGGLASAFPHKIISEIAKQKHLINQVGSIAPSCCFLIEAYRRLFVICGLDDGF